jgi:hypothetical protein
MFHARGWGVFLVGFLTLVAESGTLRGNIFRKSGKNLTSGSFLSRQRCLESLFRMLGLSYRARPVPTNFVSQVDST